MNVKELISVFDALVNHGDQRLIVLDSKGRDLECGIYELAKDAAQALRLLNDFLKAARVYWEKAPNKTYAEAIATREAVFYAVVQRDARMLKLQSAFHMACGTISTMPEWADKHPQDVVDEYMRLAAVQEKSLNIDADWLRDKIKNDPDDECCEAGIAAVQENSDV